MIVAGCRRNGKSHLQEKLIEYCRTNGLSLLILGDPTRLLTEDGEWVLLEPNSRGELFAPLIDEGLLPGEIGVLEGFSIIESRHDFGPPPLAVPKPEPQSYGPPARGRGGKIKRW